MTDLYKYRVLRVLRVLDGDTFDAEISLGFGISASFRFRLVGVDAPEVYGRGASEEGRAAKAFVEEWVVGRQLIAETYKGSQETMGLGDGAFGRWLADLIDAHTDDRLSDDLVDAGHAARSSRHSAAE